MNKETILYKTLHHALSLKRPHNTNTTDNFAVWLSKRIPANVDWHFDTVGNLHVDARFDDKNTTLFVAHIDTVHHTEGVNHIEMTDTHWFASGDVLGADDGAGVAMLMHLLCSGVPAYYIFTQGEERGGIGAKFIADEYDWLLMQFDRAIAFDRRGIESVITHQGFGRCCSDTFGNALAGALDEHNLNLMHLVDDTGIYTDTAEFTEIIPECTNISVGYYSEHTQKEHLDLVYFAQLAVAVLLIDWDALPTERDPSVLESKFDSYGYGSMYGQYDDYGYGKPINTINNSLVDYRVEELYDALIDAKYGDYTFLITLIAEAVYPDDPIMARHHIKQRHISADLIDSAMRDIDIVDPDVILFELFDSAYAM